MTLTQYLSQENPKNDTEVTLKKSEYVVGVYRNTGTGIRIANVIVGGTGHIYVRKKTSNVLYIPDVFGHPAQKTCFVLGK